MAVLTVLPFTCQVEVQDPTTEEWEPEAQGSSVLWLRDALADARALRWAPRVRLVMMPGREVLDEAKWLGT